MRYLEGLQGNQRQLAVEKAQEMLEGYEGDNLESGVSKLESCTHNCAAYLLNFTTHIWWSPALLKQKSFIQRGRGGGGGGRTQGFSTQSESPPRNLQIMMS